MRIRLVLLVAVLVTLAACEDVAKFVLLERQTIESGSFRGFHIGSSKAEVLKQARELGVHAVSPRPTMRFQISGKNIEELSKVKEIGEIRQAEGVRVADGRGLAIDLEFQNGIVTRIRRSVPAKGNSWFYEGQSLDEAIEKLRVQLLMDPYLAVFPIVFFEGDGWVRLDAPSKEVLRELAAYDAWTFGVVSDKPRGANFDLYFEGDRLKKIEYRRPRIALD